MSETLFGEIDHPYRTGATLSDDGRYRYELTRWWNDPGAFLQRALIFVMLNPSTADAHLDDPTIRRCVGFAKREGFDGLRVVNLYAYRATNPDDMRAADDPVGPEADHWLRKAALRAYNTRAPIVCAWGTKADPLRVAAFMRLADRNTSSPCGRYTRLVSLGVTKEGHPRHPLYVRGDQPLLPFGESA